MPAAASMPRARSSFSTHSTQTSPLAWAWVCRSAARLLKPMVAGYGLRATPAREPPFSSSSQPTGNASSALSQSGASPSQDEDEILRIFIRRRGYLVRDGLDVGGMQRL